MQSRQGQGGFRATMRVLGAACSWAGQGFRCQPEGKGPRRGLWGGGRAWPLSLAARGLAEWAQRTLALGPFRAGSEAQRADVPSPKGECSLGTISTPHRWPVSRRPGHRMELLAAERVGMEARLPRCWPSFLFLGKEGAAPSALGACPKASTPAWLSAPERLGRGEDPQIPGKRDGGGKGGREEVSVLGASPALSPSASCRAVVSRVPGSSEDPRPPAWDILSPPMPGRPLEGGLPLGSPCPTPRQMWDSFPQHHPAGALGHQALWGCSWAGVHSRPGWEGVWAGGQVGEGGNWVSPDVKMLGFGGA